MNAETAEAWVLPVLLIVLPLVWTATRDWFSREARALRRLEAWQALAAKVVDGATRAAIEEEAELMARDLVVRQQVARTRAGVFRELMRGSAVPRLAMTIGLAVVVIGSLSSEFSVSDIPEWVLPAVVPVVALVALVLAKTSSRDEKAVREAAAQFDRARKAMFEKRDE